MEYSLSLEAISSVAMSRNMYTCNTRECNQNALWETNYNLNKLGVVRIP